MPGTQDGVHLIGRTLLAIAPEVATLQYYARVPGVVRASIDGTEHFIALRQLPDSGGAVLAATSIARFEAAWRDEISLNVTLFAGVSAILMVVLYAYYIQAKRARDADAVFAESNLRVETALSRGRCGLWDFDLDNRRLFWSRSMYEMLGMPGDASVLSFGDAARLMHVEDGAYTGSLGRSRKATSARSIRCSGCAMRMATMYGFERVPR